MSTLFETAYSLRQLLDAGGRVLHTSQGCRVVTYSDARGEHVELSTQPPLAIVADPFKDLGRTWPGR